MKPSKPKPLGVRLDEEKWRPVFDGQDFQDKVDNFTPTAVQILSKTLPTRFYKRHIPTALCLSR